VAPRAETAHGSGSPGQGQLGSKERFVLRRRRRTPFERGAVLVETAIVLPVLLLVVLGIIEYSSAYHDSSVTADSARAGGRVASAQALNPAYATDAASSVASALQTLPAAAPQEMWVYKANANGYPYPAGNTSFTTCSTTCIKYRWLSASKQFDTANPSGSGWSAASQNVCTQPFDEIGIYVKIQHSFITNLFGATVTLDDHAVFRLEPTSLATC
jgi:Flp pilus assembly protein TadG